MREILFRGKPLENPKSPFIYGSLIVFNDCYSIKEHKPFAFAKPINPKTLGQYTGIKDKNGVSVFEGDIVNCVSRTDEARMVIIFEEGEFRMVPVERFNDYSTGAGYYAIRCFEKEVIGNIYDNPELLEENK